MKTLEERFWVKVDKSGDCWLWTAGTKGKGYGQFWVDGKTQRAHRVAWELTFGPVPEGVGYHGTCVCHRCDVPLCVNPSHLFLGTNAENLADRDAKGRAARGEAGGRAKLTAAQVVEIRAAEGSQRAIARRFDVSPRQVARIRAGKRWAHLPNALLKQQHNQGATQ